MLHTNFFNAKKDKKEVFYFFFYILIILLSIQCGLIVITPVYEKLRDLLPSASKMEVWAVAELVCATLSILLYQLIYRLVAYEGKKVAPGWTIVLLGCTYGAIERQDSWYDGWDPTNVALILWVLFLWFCVFAIILSILFISRWSQSFHCSLFASAGYNTGILMILAVLAVVAGVPVATIQPTIFLGVVVVFAMTIFEVAAADE